MKIIGLIIGFTGLIGIFAGRIILGIILVLIGGSIVGAADGD